MIYQHVSKRAKILLLASLHIALYANNLIRFALPISMPCFKSIIFYQYSPKTKLFLKKNAKFSSAGGSVPRPPKQPPQLRISGYAPATLCTVYNHMSFRSFCFEQFFLHRSVAKLVMLNIIDVCLMLNCFLFEKIYLHYALWDFDSILLHCTKLFIRQSIDREQILMSLLKTPPLKNPAYATEDHHAMAFPQTLK